MAEPKHDAAYLLEAALWFEYCAAFDVNITTPAAKNMGLAHVHLVRSQAGGLLPAVPDPLGASRLLGDRTVADLHPAAAGPDWRAWASSRFQHAWGDFLQRNDAKNDPQYDTIKDLYLKVISTAKRGVDGQARTH